VIDTHNKK